MTENTFNKIRYSIKSSNREGEVVLKGMIGREVDLGLIGLFFIHSWHSLRVTVTRVISRGFHKMLSSYFYGAAVMRAA